MSGAFTHSRAARPSTTLQRKPEGLRLSQPDDAFEREADRAAAAIGQGATGLSLSRMAVGPIQRDGPIEDEIQVQFNLSVAEKKG